MTKLNILLVISLLVMGASDALAAGKYGMAGCGLGSMALPGKNGKEQIVAATLNSTGVQTVGITIGTSNCDEHSEVAMAYISVNQEALKKDASRGAGESIDGLSKVMNCSQSAELGEVLQKNYVEIFGAPHFDSKAVNENIQATIRKTPTLQAQCLSMN